MKITCLLGSPGPDGNSTTLAKHFCSTAEKLGATVQTFALNTLHYKGCQECMACKTKMDKCILQDDLTQVLESIRESDVLVMATPVYMAEMTSPLRAFSGGTRTRERGRGSLLRPSIRGRSLAPALPVGAINPYRNSGGKEG